jgi:hypothetical protein
MADMTKKRYVRRGDRPVVAVRLAFDTDGLFYRKWGGEQRAKPGDWVVDSGDDVYTVDAAVFARTYTQTGPGTYIKTSPVWARRATSSGNVQTKEGVTHYEAGDYLVSPGPDMADEYAVRAATFESLYVQADEASDSSLS